MKLSKDIENYDKYYFEITHNDNEIIFHLKNSVLFSKNYLIIKHRKSNRRIIRKFDKSKVSFFKDELYEFNKTGFFDIFLKVDYFNTTYLKRIPFKLQNDLIISDEANLREIKFYKTRFGNLSFEYNEIIKPRDTDDIKVSAIVLVYNGEPYLKTCLTSLANQTLKNLEVLLVNDASTDNSLEICEEFAQKYSNFRIINKKENKGLANSVNMGIRHAKGEYIILVDNDDIIPENAYELLYNKALETGADVSIGRANFFVKNQSEMNFLDITPWKNERIVNDIRDYPDLFYDVFYWNKLIKKDLIIQNDIVMPEHIKYYGDRCFTHRVYSYARKISIIPDCVYLWRKRLDSLSRTRYDIDNFHDRMNAYDYDLDYLSDFYPDYFNTLFRRALFPIQGILESSEFEEVFIERVSEFFKKGQKKVKNIYDNNFYEIVNIYAFLITNGLFDELKELVQLDLKSHCDVLDENRKSYWNLPEFRNPDLNIPDELFEIRYLQQQFINIDEIIIDEENILFNSIRLPKYFDLNKGEIVFKGRAKQKDIYKDLCHSFQVEKISDDNVFNVKVPLSQLNLFEVYNINFRFTNKFGYSKDIKLSDRYIKNINNHNDDIEVRINSNNHISLIVQNLDRIFDIDCGSEELAFKINNADRVKKDFKIYLLNKKTEEEFFLDYNPFEGKYLLKWDLFLDKNTEYDMFMRVYTSDAKLNETVKIREEYIGSVLNSYDNAEIIITDESVKLKSF